MTNHGLIEVIAQRLQATFPKTGPGELLHLWQVHCGDNHV